MEIVVNKYCRFFFGLFWRILLTFQVSCLQPVEKDPGKKKNMEKVERFQTTIYIFLGLK